jgi:hypothetical protein
MNQRPIAVEGNYSKFSKEDFDAMVTGELTHFALWFETVIVGIITVFLAQPNRREQFIRVLMRREGLTFQDKIEIARALLLDFDSDVAVKLKPLLNRVEAFKATRNALAHGHDVSPEGVSGPTMWVGIVTRSGHEKRIEITPESHAQLMNGLDVLLSELQEVLALLKSSDSESADAGNQ